VSERRNAWQMKSVIQILSAALLLAAIFTVVSFFVLFKTIAGLHSAFTWQLAFVVVQLCFSGGVILIFLGLFLVFLRRGIGPLGRIDKILDSVINGNYSLRISVRKKDLVYPFAEKINKIIELLEKRSQVKN